MLGTNWFKRRILFFWYKRIKHLDIVGFFMGIPVIRTKHLEEESKKELPD